MTETDLFIMEFFTYDDPDMRSATLDYLEDLVLECDPDISYEDFRDLVDDDQIRENAIDTYMAYGVSSIDYDTLADALADKVSYAFPTEEEIKEHIREEFSRQVLAQYLAPRQNYPRALRTIVDEGNEGNSVRFVNILPTKNFSKKPKKKGFFKRR